MGMQVIPIPTEVVSHSHSQFCVLLQFRWDSHGISVPIGNPIPMHISTSPVIQSMSCYGSLWWRRFHVISITFSYDTLRFVQVLVKLAYMKRISKDTVRSLCTLTSSILAYAYPYPRAMASYDCRMCFIEFQRQFAQGTMIKYLLILFDLFRNFRIFNHKSDRMLICHKKNS